MQAGISQEHYQKTSSDGIFPLFWQLRIEQTQFNWFLLINFIFQRIKILGNIVKMSIANPRTDIEAYGTILLSN